MEKIIVASKNPVKLAAVRNGFERIFPGRKFETTGEAVESAVRDQPASDEETMSGAVSRAAQAARQVPEADYWMGIEGGIEDHPDGMTAFAWVVVQSSGMTGKARSGTFFLPAKIAALVREGKELGEADDIVFQQRDSKQNNGAIGLLTDNVIDRTLLYEHAVILALLPFKNESLYRGDNS